MTEEELKAFRESLLSEVMTEVHKANSGLASSITKQLKDISATAPKEEKSTTTTSVEEKELKTQVSELTERLNQADAEKKHLKTEGALRNAIDAIPGVKSKATLTKLLTYELSSKLSFSDDGKAYVEEGENATLLDTYVNNYVQSDEAFKPRKQSNIPLVKDNEKAPSNKLSKEDILDQLTQN